MRTPESNPVGYRWLAGHFGVTTMPSGKTLHATIVTSGPANSLPTCYPNSGALGTLFCAFRVCLTIFVSLQLLYFKTFALEAEEGIEPSHNGFANHD